LELVSSRYFLYFLIFILSFFSFLFSFFFWDATTNCAPPFFFPRNGRVQYQNLENKMAHNH
jgi:hypothetical protein